MRSNTLNSLAIFALLVFMAACKPKKIIVAPPANTATSPQKSNNRAQIVENLKANDFMYNTLVLRGKTTLSVDGDENDVNLNIRIKKDKMIWVSVTALGGAIEVARLSITPDSLILLNRLKKTLAKKPFSYIHDFTSAQVSFGLLQAILSGNTYALFLNEPSKLVSENGVWVASGTTDNLAFRCLFNTLLKPNELALNDANASQSLNVTYQQHTKIGKGLFPSNLKISSRVGTKKIEADITFTKIEPNTPLEFPFSVPKNFQLIK